MGADPGMAGKVCVSETTVHLHILAHASLPLSSYHREHMETEPFFEKAGDKRSKRAPCGKGALLGEFV